MAQIGNLVYDDTTGMVDLDATAKAAGFDDSDHCEHGTHPDDDCMFCDN